MARIGRMRWRCLGTGFEQTPETLGNIKSKIATLDQDIPLIPKYSIFTNGNIKYTGLKQTRE